MGCSRSDGWFAASVQLANNLWLLAALGYNRCSETPLVTSACWLLLAITAAHLVTSAVLLLLVITAAQILPLVTSASAQLANNLISGPQTPLAAN